MSKLLVTLDLDWASEAAIEQTLAVLRERGIAPTVFVTHRSPCVEGVMNELEVGLHPYFGEGSSHGSTIEEVVSHVMDLPHNLPAFRCHRFASCNASKQAMQEAGMEIVSNVCTDREVVAPFRDRIGLIEVPIFLEDGGYLWQEHPLTVEEGMRELLMGEGVKVILIHPMHFCLNTPHFDFMRQIKGSISREEWRGLTGRELEKLRWQKRGVRDFMLELFEVGLEFVSMRDVVSGTSR